MIVKTRWQAVADVNTLEGLGRFPKECVVPDNITLLPNLSREEIGLQDTKRIVSMRELNDLLRYMASFYRKRLLHYLHTEFHAENFNTSMNRRYLHIA